MKKAFAYLFFFLLSGGQAGAQNLIPNGSFESVISCPASLNNSFYWGPDLLQYSPPWRRACWSADFLHDCGFNSFAGSQAPHTGLGKAGFMAWNDNATDFREFLQVLLIHPMRAGVKYRFSMYLSLADDCRYGVSQFGVHFYNRYVSDTTACYDLTGSMPDALLNSPGQLPLTDKNGWTYVEGFYTATGGEDHLVIGHFPKDAQTVTINTGSGSRNDSYYYMDDAALDSIGFTSLWMPNIITPNGDGLNDLLAPPPLDSMREYRMTVYNRWGAIVKKINANPPAWNGTGEDGKPVSDGVYFYHIDVLDNTGKSYRQGGFVQVFQ
ncbi:MAG: PKD domain-containing protein [Bacteroidetes bacterium]|nr:MAG: PKD domain-containing protein [Bacteroidota bacterium]